MDDTIRPGLAYNTTEALMRQSHYQQAQMPLALALTTLGIVLIKESE